MYTKGLPHDLKPETLLVYWQIYLFKCISILLMYR